MKKDQVERKMKILIGHDGSEHANCALKDLLRAGLPSEAAAVVISVPATQNERSKDSSGYSEEAVEQAAALAKQASGLVRAHFPAWEVRTEMAVGSVVRNVAKKVRQWQPDLIVLGLQAEPTAGRKVFGGVAQRIAAQADCSVRITCGLLAVPEQAPRVLLCVDDSPATETAVQAVAARHWPKGTEIRLLTAIDPFDYSIPELLDSAIERAKSRHRLIANVVECTPAFTSSLVAEGEAAQVILQVAEQWRPDVIFLAPGNKNRLRRLLPGSVSGKVAARAQCPIELVRSQSTTAPAFAFQQAPAAAPAYD